MLKIRIFLRGSPRLIRPLAAIEFGRCLELFLIIEKPKIERGDEEPLASQHETLYIVLTSKAPFPAITSVPCLTPSS